MCHQTHLAIWTITDFLTFVQLRNSEMINYENISHNVAITNLGQKRKITLYLDLYQQSNLNKS